jgi:hypothetical protein
MSAEKSKIERADGARGREPSAWRKSSHSNDRGNCVEMGLCSDGRVAFRDSKDPHGPRLVFAPEQVTAFLRVLSDKPGDTALRVGWAESD